jgi:hypothetical protein
MLEALFKHAEIRQKPNMLLQAAQKTSSRPLFHMIIWKSVWLQFWARISL